MFILDTALIIIISLGLISSQSFPQGYYLKLIGIKCTPKEEILANMTCKTRAKGRYETSLTLNFDIVKPLEELNVR
jgi:hypothetical protein